MRVVYQSTDILERLKKARIEAQIAQREIEKVVVTREEAREIVEVARTATWSNSVTDFEIWLRAYELTGDRFLRPQPVVRMLGLRIEVE